MSDDAITANVHNYKCTKQITKGSEITMYTIFVRYLVLTRTRYIIRDYV